MKKTKKSTKEPKTKIKNQNISKKIIVNKSPNQKKYKEDKMILEIPAKYESYIIDNFNDQYRNIFASLNKLLYGNPHLYEKYDNEYTRTKISDISIENQGIVLITILSNELSWKYRNDIELCLDLSDMYYKLRLLLIEFLPEKDLISFYKLKK